MLKSEIRKDLLKQRYSLSKKDLEEKSATITDHFFSQTILNGNETIHCFLPIEKLNEINTWLIFKKLWNDFPKITTATSITDKESLRHVIIDKNISFKEDKLGIPTPQGGNTIDPTSIDLVLVPLLAFDQRLHRVGYGKGYYDKFLATCRNDTLKIGLSLFPPLNDEISDISEHDIALDKVIYPY